MYLLGHFVEKDESKTFNLGIQVASKHYSRGLRFVGWSYRNGCGVYKDLSEAPKYFTKAMECDSAEAIQGIAYIYKTGDNIIIDTAKF
jgi:TPR repeat protein